MFNSISNQNNYKSKISFKAKLLPTKAQASYFFKEYPLLGKYIPQHCYGFQKYDGTELTRYLLTSGCSECSKLSIYDNTKKMGFLAHIDDYSELNKTFGKIKKALQEHKMNPNNLIAQHISGIFVMSPKKMDSIQLFLERLGLKKENIKQTPFAKGAVDGGVLDLTDGAVHDLDTWNPDFSGINKRLSSVIKLQLKGDQVAYKRAMEQLNTKGHSVQFIFKEKYTEV